MNTIELQSITIESLSNPAIYQTSECLQKMARDAGTRHYETMGRGKMGRGDFKAACLAGKYPELVFDEIRKHLAEIARIDDLLKSAKISLETVGLPQGWSATLGYPNIALAGPYHGELPKRLRRLDGFWDDGDNTWYVPTEKHASLKRIFANAEKARVQNLAADEAARAEKERANKMRAAVREEEYAAAKRSRKTAIAERIRVPFNKHQVGDMLNGKPIASFGREWYEPPKKIRVTDDTACVYGMQPGLDYYPTITIPGGMVCYAYFD